MNELTALPCPFCGTQPYVAMKDVAVISCRSDDCFGPRTTADYLVDAVKQWNARAPQPVAVAQGVGHCGVTAEDIYACCESTLIGFREELTEQQIKFICDQVSRKSVIASPAQSSWQPIATAPKDRFILVYCHEDNSRWLAKWQGGEWYGSDCEHGIRRTGHSWGDTEYVTGWFVSQWRDVPAYSVSSTHCGTIEAAAQRLVDELLAQHISRDKFTIGIGSGELHAYIQLSRVDCRADIIDGWPVVWHFNVGPAVAHTSTDKSGAA